MDLSFPAENVATDKNETDSEEGPENRPEQCEPEFFLYQLLSDGWPGDLVEYGRFEFVIHERIPVRLFFRRNVNLFLTVLL